MPGDPPLQGVAAQPSSTSGREEVVLRSAFLSSSHDLRHIFAVQTLTDAHREGVEVKGRLAVLSTYLGHGEPTYTYWLLSATPLIVSR
jgi:hypothetical protein